MRSAVLLTAFILLPLALAAPFHPNHRRFTRHLSLHAPRDDSQSSLTLDKTQVQAGLRKDGQQDPAEGQAASLISSNNFINFCLTQKGVPLTNGGQVKGGSCNPTVMGRVVAENVMPSSKFYFPRNLDNSLEENETFTVKMAVKNLQTGQFVNAKSNYFAAPSQVNGQGQLIGHSHVVIQAIQAMNSTEVLDPSKFAFFQGLNAKAVNGILCANVTKGLPAGTYRMGSINTAANHQPALVSVAQHGMLDDIVYFTVKQAGFTKDKNGSDSAKTGHAAKASKMTSSTASKATAAVKSSQSTASDNEDMKPRMGDMVHNAMLSSANQMGRVYPTASDSHVGSWSSA